VRDPHRQEARACYDRAARWVTEQQSLPSEYVRELVMFRAKADSLLAASMKKLPANVFAGEQ
jgi:hypothetical protein